MVRLHHPYGPRLATAAADAAAGALLPYRLRRAAADGMLHGGVRVVGLALPPPAVKLTHSVDLKLPTLQEERDDLGVAWHAVPQRLVPKNLAFMVRNELVRLKMVELHARAVAEPAVHRSPKDMTILPAAATDASRRIHGRFVPPFSIKPMVDVAGGQRMARGRGLREASAKQFQELLNRRGHGQKKNLSHLPQMSREQQGHIPERGY